MFCCQDCQAQMLEYLYGLLDGTDRQQFQAHLESCADCQSALKQAQVQQNLLATAARMEFPSVQFQPPVDQPATIPCATGSSSAPATPADGQTARGAGVGRRRVSWRRLGAVAAVLVAALGLGIPGTWLARDYWATSATVSQGEAVIAQAGSEKSEAAQKLRELPLQRDQKIEGIRNAVRERQLNVVVTGPATVQSGAPTEYRIQTSNLNGQPTAAQLTVRVLNEQGKQSEPMPVVGAGNGTYRLTLPPDLPVKPNSQMTLVVCAKKEGGSLAEVREELPLARPVYLTHLTTDKPMYQPGEVVHFRSLTLDRATLKPAQEALRFHYSVTTPTGAEREILIAGNSLHAIDVRGASRGEVLGPDGKPVRGLGAGDFLLDPSAPGGEYTLTVREEQGRFPEQKRKFTVNVYQKPRLNKELEFNRKSYGAGDEVQALCKALRAEGGVVSEKDVEATVTIDGKTYDAGGMVSNKPIKFKTDKEGRVTVRFRLPKEIEKGQASLSVKFLDGGNVEAIVRPITLVLKNLQVEFFPEGGDLIAGLPNRVYFQARTPLGKPADLKGHLLEDGKPIAVEVQTLTDDKEAGVNQGMGRFEFTPKAEPVYELQIESPAGITKRFALPKPKTDGVVLRVEEGVVDARQPIKVAVRSSKERNLMVGAYCRGRLLDSVQLKKGQTEAELKPAGLAGGVCRVTVFEQIEAGGQRRELKPLAERLIYRTPADNLHVVIKANQTSYVPGQKAKVTLAAIDEKEEPTPVVMMVAVVDKSVLTLADEKTARSMPTHFLLTTEVRKPEDLEHADFLLGTHPKARPALDLLLGTQGWRRFAEQDPAKFRETHKEEAERLLVAMGQSTPQITDFAREEINKARTDYQNQVAELADKYHQADTTGSRAKQDAAFVAAAARLNRYHDWFDQFRRTGIPVLAVLVLLGAIIVLIIALTRRLRQSVPYFAAVGLGAAVLVLLVQLPSAKQGAVNDGGAVALVMPNPTANVDDQALPEEKAADLANPVAAHRWDENKKAEKPNAKDKAGGQGFPHALPPGVPPMPRAPRPGEFPAVQRAQLDRDGDNKGKRELLEAEEGKGFGLGGRGKAKEDVLRDMNLATKPNAGLMAKEGLPGRGGWQEQKRMLDEAQMQAFRRARGIGAGEADGMLALPPAVVREYAHQRIPGSTPEARSDFAETLYWHPVLVLPQGKGEVSFELCDSVTSFQVTAYAHTLDGRLGAATQLLDSRLPFTLQPKTPLEVTASDKLVLPLSIANNTTEARKVAVTLAEHAGLTPLGDQPAAEARIDPEASVRKLYRFQPSIKEGDAVLVFKGKTDAFGDDQIRTKFRVVPEGFPVAGSHSDMLEGSASTRVMLPETWVKGTLKLQAQVFPSTLADLQKGLEGLLREPHGCFEQTSTSNYPNLLILDYLHESNQAQPEVERRARDLLSRGYQKLTSFECLNSGKQKREGYEWFGGTAPAHEALTAYGLLQFRDLARVQDIDLNMVERTRAYLLSQRDHQGGFKRNPRALDTFGRAPDNITNAYIVWALTESGKEDDLSTELKSLNEQAQKSKDPYFVALVANALFNRSQTKEASELLRNLVAAQKEDGHLDAEKTSITGSGGRDLQIETTSMAVLGWLKANPGEFAKPVDKAVKWIGKQRGGYGGFGSTQATILALKALLTHARENKRTAEGGELSLFVEEKKVASLPFSRGVSDTLTLNLEEAEKHLKPGVNKIRLEVTGKNVFPYTLGWTYQTLQPVSADNCPVRLSTKLARTEAVEADAVRLQVSVENVSGKGQGMAVAIIGLPGGMSVPEDLKQLKEYIRTPEDGSRPLLGAFEIRGRELVLYWRDLAPGQKIEVPVDLICRVPGEYSGPASRAYLYYNADHKHWVEPLKMTITAKEN